jgi:predicted transcriptional regulator
MFVKRVEFDAEYVAMLKEEVIKFLAELNAKISKLNERLNNVKNT